MVIIISTRTSIVPYPHHHRHQIVIQIVIIIDQSRQLVQRRCRRQKNFTFKYPQIHHHQHQQVVRRRIHQHRRRLNTAAALAHRNQPLKTINWIIWA